MNGVNCALEKIATFRSYFGESVYGLSDALGLNAVVIIALKY